MVRKKTFGVSTAVGGVMTVAQVTHAQWFSDHTWVWPASLAFLAISAFLWIAQFSWVQKHVLGLPGHSDEDHQSGTKQETIGDGSPTLTENTSGRDLNTGVSFGSGNSFIGADALNVAAQFRPFPQPTKEIIAPKSSLKIVTIDQYKSIPNEKFFLRGSTSLYYLVVENDHAEDGRPNRGIDLLQASLKFLGLEDKSHHVDMAYWKNKSESLISISPGHRREVFLGQTKEGWWFYYGNPNKYLHEWPSAYDDDSPNGDMHWRNFAIPEKCGIEVTLFSNQDHLVKGRVVVLLEIDEAKKPTLRIQDET